MSDNRKEFEEWHLYQYGIIPTDKEWFMYYSGKKSATEQSSKEIERLNALVAMQAEALKEQKESWKALRNILESTQRELSDERSKVLALSNRFSEMAQWLKDVDSCESAEAIKSFLTNIQATAEAYDREHAAKVLEDYANRLRGITSNACNTGYATQFDCALLLDKAAAELRAANKKD